MRSAATASAQCDILGFHVGKGLFFFRCQVFRFRVSGFRVQKLSPHKIDRIWLLVFRNQIPIYPIFYLLQGDYIRGFRILGCFRHTLSVLLGLLRESCLGPCVFEKSFSAPGFQGGVVIVFLKQLLLSSHVIQTVPNHSHPNLRPQ